MLLNRIVLALAALMATTGASEVRAEAGAGESVFEQHCAVCHSNLPGEINAAPSLFKIVGRKAGSMPSFPYSSGMKNSGATWTPANLDAFIASPRKMMPRSNMAFTGLSDPQQRADLIAYLAKLK